MPNTEESEPESDVPIEFIGCMRVAVAVDADLLVVQFMADADADQWEKHLHTVEDVTAGDAYSPAVPETIVRDGWVIEDASGAWPGQIDRADHYKQNPALGACRTALETGDAEYLARRRGDGD